MADYRSAFEKYEWTAWPHRYRAQAHVYSIAGGTPSDPNTAEGWIRSKIEAPDDRIRQMVAEAMEARGLSSDEALEEINRLKHLNGFKRDAENGLYIEGRIVKAAIKEAASIAAAAGKLPLTKWGKTSKYIQGFVAEHIVVEDDKIYLGRDTADGINQSFPENKRIGQRGIQLVEFCTDVDIIFTVKTDWEFSDENWGMIWLTGAEEGIGASRSQGFGKYTVTEWKKLEEGE
jgi:hypothetical protein